MNNQPNQKTPAEEGKGKSIARGDKAREEVRENEDASLPDDSYSFDEDNTANEEYHDVDEEDLEDIDFDNDDDFVY